MENVQANIYQILESLRKQEADTKFQDERTKAVEERQRALQAAAKQRMSELVGKKSVVISGRC